MKSEIKRAFRNKFFLFYFGVGLLFILLGYILLITIDKVTNITYSDISLSVYTVFSQFGPMIYTALTITLISSDYKDKNIVFYREMGNNSVKYFLKKVGIIFIISFITSIFVACIISLFYKELSMLLPYFLKLEAVLLSFGIINLIVVFIFKDFTKSFFINLFLWIGGIVLAGTNKKLSFLAYFDASMKNYNTFEQIIDKKILNPYALVANDYLFVIIILAISLIFSYIFMKRWWKNGIQ
ncbi:MAG: hypothetical protein PUG67_05530 [Peptoniphilaceae bacterium]|nr:hypothetical protein [Peptoniphilaceae bacterium]MDY6018482.1 hypothetical protein [Anaerococcus sp.]